MTLSQYNRITGQNLKAVATIRGLTGMVELIINKNVDGLFDVIGFDGADIQILHENDKNVSVANVSILLMYQGTKFNLQWLN